MQRRTFTSELSAAADRIADITEADLAALLRRAALMLANAPGPVVEPDLAEALDSIAGEIGISRADLVGNILREWLERNAYLPVPYVEEDSETDGSA